MYAKHVNIGKKKKQIFLIKSKISPCNFSLKQTKHFMLKKKERKKSNRNELSLNDSNLGHSGCMNQVRVQAEHRVCDNVMWLEKEWLFPSLSDGEFHVPRLQEQAPLNDISFLCGSVD